MIQVTKPITPNLDQVQKYLEKVHTRAWLTNNGPLVRELTERLEDYLGVRNLILTANGTLALQVAYKALGLDKEAVTSPFTFVATASAMKWQGITPRFADIEADTLGLCPEKAAAAITGATQAIVPVHVYGNPCDVEGFERLGQARKLPVIYDASHTFSVSLKGRSVLNWGDASTLSFHATKLFHTVEGGGIVFKDDDAYQRAHKMINFGLGGSPDDIATPGINAKMSEIHAAYGLCVLDSIEQVLERRAEILNAYREGMNGVVKIPKWREGATQNAAYAPILLESEQQCLKVLDALKSEGVVARRYFYPSLNTVSEFQVDLKAGCPISVDAASRALCLPIYPDLADEDVQKIIEGVKAGCMA
ncbi:DegT/DnrJ/EryC1/StrS family aminotransferase [Marinobacter salarius]|uniref:DegT/DnrJ/EryC1/StrS family aminotransferase n=1 Tax=Marinobacter salarius TaxID=1420917 RepID=UPI001D192887|nr:DegT/DnrJ/EryC1/StrS family aminotransferase [Marinobacter salarius]MCC4282818.1 DegT/DnrJ/EryC1/StrS family aminotransferase [Marinobacter salarius]